MNNVQSFVDDQRLVKVMYLFGVVNVIRNQKGVLIGFVEVNGIGSFGIQSVFLRIFGVDIMLKIDFNGFKDVQILVFMGLVNLMKDKVLNRYLVIFDFCIVFFQ